ncbi:MAG: DUF2059 domain-containing protein [Betaproteobacteria bacterium]|nr:DUF2059 domain-containing protein [Betaproteobacteria bacterium]
MIERQQTYCRDQAKSIGPKIVGEFKKQVPEADGAVWQEIEAAYQAFVDTAEPNWTVEEAVGIWAEHYGAQLTEAELDQILIFYKSPIGQKDISATQKAMPSWSAFFAERNQEVLDTALNAYVERLTAIVQRARAAKRGA